MKKELEYFFIGRSFGGNQNWFTDYPMRIGGCAAIAACDGCVAMERAGVKKGLYPFNVNNLTKADYLKFGMQMKPYLRPRHNGIDRLDIYEDGMKRYLKDIGNASLRITTFPSENPISDAIKAVKRQIDGNMPIPYLLLRHKNYNFRYLLWHWFMLTGYEEFDAEFYVKITTYGEYRYLSFRELWDDGYRENGGMILFA